MDPLFLPDVEHDNAPSPYTTAIRAMQDRGVEYPQIWHLFAYPAAGHDAPGALHPGGPAWAGAAQSRACAS